MFIKPGFLKITLYVFTPLQIQDAQFGSTHQGLKHLLETFFLKMLNSGAKLNNSI